MRRSSPVMPSRRPTPPQAIASPSSKATRNVPSGGWKYSGLGIAPEPQTAELAIEVLDPWLVIIAVVIVAPVAEEAFFRGVVFNAWRREAGRRWAFVGSAALFAAIHLSLLSLLPIFVLGLGLAWVYDRTKSLLAPMAMHATVNGISVALALLVRFDVLRLPV